MERLIGLLFVYYFDMKNSGKKWECEFLKYDKQIVGWEVGQ